MSLLWHCNDPFDLPVRPWNQRFGLALEPEDFLTPRGWLTNRGYFRPWRSAASKQDHGSTMNVDKDKFQVNLDVQQFKPEEISVKIAGQNLVTVEGKHEEKEDEHGSIYRHFLRKYVLPKGHDIGRVESHLSSDGILTITAPKVGNNGNEYRYIPVIQTGQPSKPDVEKKGVPGAKGDK